ncbi:predicted protein [Pyrenophora tritici-repentis Pt-1C-BFP]|uniref:Uncharacterized protein n=1 Tax=Pyrenophora tritici-repentis (strain Pt-1C-BFP) TaxID=426418 RepID=B2WDD2_PYRTR|nr:uncharacterized protein PTRG_07991 [Pyrenophora tritici-repentis Pt-1C-BFP]EDU50910.1 predicted protein [Pyrenophora tritici-repentis Pt-1C-BFP]
MADTHSPERLYQADFDKAAKHFDDGDIEKCIELTKYNMTHVYSVLTHAVKYFMSSRCSDLSAGADLKRNVSLPPYYVTRNCILLTSALDDWDEADTWRLIAQSSYKTCFWDAKKRDDVHALEILEGLRGELDELKKYKEEDLDALYAAMNDNDDDIDDEEEDDDEYEEKDESAVAVAENQDEVAAETCELPIRSIGKF